MDKVIFFSTQISEKCYEWMNTMRIYSHLLTDFKQEYLAYGHWKIIIVL